MRVIPGIDLAALSGPFTKEQFALLGKPTVELEAGDVGPDAISLDALVSALGSGVAGLNYLRNGNFAEPLWGRGSTPVSCPAGLRTFRADDWFCLPQGAAVTYEREQAGPDFRSLHSAKLTGASGAGIVDFGQDIPGHLSAALKTTFTVSFYLENDTGANLTPLVRIDTADSFNNFEATTNRFSQAVDEAAATANWKRWTMTIDGSTFPNIANGLRFLIRLPSGALGSGAKSVNVSQVKLEIAATATGFIVDPKEQAADATAAGGTVRNFLENGNFAESRWGGLSKTCVAGSDNFLADAWFARPGGVNGLVYEKDVDAPDTLSLLCAKLTGFTGTTTVDFGQNLARDIAAELRAPAVFSVWVKNSTGADFAPLARIDTCDSANNFASVTNRVSVALDLCPAGVWTRVSYSFIGSDLTNWINGARVSLRIPEGSLAAGASVVKLAQGRLELGDSVTPFVPADTQHAAGTAVIAASRSLKIRSISVTQITINADEVVLKDGSGAAMLARAVNTTVAISSSGANGLDTGSEATSTWYALWIISDGSNHRGLLSLSFTAPLLPAGYYYSALVGAARNDSSSDLRPFHQLGRKVWQAPVNVAANAVLTTSYAALDVSAAVPPNAILAGGTIGGTTTNLRAAIAASADGIGELILNIADGGGTVTSSPPSSTAFAGGAVRWELPFITAQQIFWKTPLTTIHHTMDVSSFEL